MKKRFFMCDPNNFDVLWKYKTNTWMNPANRPNKALAKNQWHALYEACRELAEVKVAPSHEELPDQVFFANAGLPYKQICVMSTFYEKPRREETNSNLKFLQRLFGPGQLYLPRTKDAGYFEGQGDAIWLNESTLIVGHGIRTDMQGIAKLENILRASCQSRHQEIRVIPVEMRKQFDFYHLDTCCFWMEKSKTFMIYPDAFTKRGLETIKSLGKVLAVSEDEAKQFVCNSVVINDNTVFMPWTNEPIKEIVNEAGYENICTFPMSEFMKSGGAVKCLLLEHNYPI